MTTKMLYSCSVSWPGSRHRLELVEMGGTKSSWPNSIFGQHILCTGYGVCSAVVVVATASSPRPQLLFVLSVIVQHGLASGRRFNIQDNRLVFSCIGNPTPNRCLFSRFSLLTLLCPGK
ncbi:hypothetical protein X797_001852 [Metarhizium robertsii]|uniref:Uncharacterized protein n=1 Tax=Metarhizium robertsii TaxID=568076 RepID=A0A0A1V2U1_9HYPO|nr:hypothetical protein X797_001852 [Metarhizium robertsii]